MRTRLVGAATAAVLAAGALATTSVLGSSHREAPRIMLDPAADNTDLYAFVAPDAPKQLTVVSNWVPLVSPSGGPYFGKLDPEAHYYVKIDNTGDGVEDVAYRWRFKNQFRNPDSFLYAIPPVNSFNDRNLNFIQTYDLDYILYRNGKPGVPSTIARNLPVAPDNAGPKTFPNYASVADGTIRNLRNGGKSFVGPVDDPFFIDLATVFDGINIDKPGRPNIGLGNQGGGKDDISGYNVHSFVLQVPFEDVTRDGKGVKGANAVNSRVGIWSTTERLSMNVGRNGKPKWKQVSRVGNPLINEVVIPIGEKDKYNATRPSRDGKNFGKYVTSPELAKRFNQLFNLGVQENDRNDIVTALLTGVPGLTEITPRRPAAADTLKINLGVPPTANPSRFGVLGGDLQGFPNGRRLADDVTDIELRVVAGALLNPAKNIPLGDGIDQNEKPFRTTFPYVAMPDSAFDAKFGRIEPAHAPVPAPIVP